MDLTELFCSIDDFSKTIGDRKDFIIEKTSTKRGTKPYMHLSEIMTIIVGYHLMSFKNFKSYYIYLQTYRRSDFPRIVSYNRFLELMPYALLPLCAYLRSRRGTVTGVSFIDSTSISVCKNIRISRNKVFKNIATRGKSTMGWFFGFKLHIIVNEVGELLAFKLTKGNTNDRAPVKELCKNIFGKLFGDKGYLSSALFSELYGSGIQLITGIRMNMKNRLMPMMDKLLLRKRFLIETINDQLKNVSDIAHSRHRSPVNFLVNLVAGLIGYTHQPKKPAIKWSASALALN